MRILHTSDWHIGRTLYGRKRYEEFEAFLTWLAGYRREGKEAGQIGIGGRSRLGLKDGSGPLHATTPQVWLSNLVTTDEVRNKLTRVIRVQRQSYTYVEIIGHKVNGL